MGAYVGKGKRVQPKPTRNNLTNHSPGDEDIDLRVELPCGHTAAPSSVFWWCRSRLELGETKFHCPALVEDGTSCGEEWKLPVIRSVALNSEDGVAGLRKFEEKLAAVAVNQFCDFKECPGCKSLVERGNPNNMRVFCTICTAAKGMPYEFCWQCLQPWEGTGRSSVGCASQKCKDANLDILQKCRVVNLPNSEVGRCPSIRACPTCGLLIEHKDMCKYVICCRCNVEFCFACLELADDCQSSKPAANYMACAKPVAPKQTTIPVWSRGDLHEIPPPPSGGHEHRHRARRVL